MPFSDLKGQDRAVGLIRRVVESDQTSLTMLFTGPPGVGKVTAAGSLARLINCETPGKTDSCGVCISCRRFDSGNHPDFEMIEAEGSVIKIEQIREFNRKLGFPPAAGDRRVCVVRQAGSMTDEAANSFLKTLEEPPPGNVIILTASEPGDLLPTIVSRCRRVAFGPVSMDHVVRVLTERTGLDPDSARLLAGMSGGSPGRAISMHGNGFLERRLEWLENLRRVREIPVHEVIALAVSLAESEKKRGKKPRAEGDDLSLSMMLEVWEYWYRDVLIAREGGPVGLLANPDFGARLKKQAERFTVEALLSAIEILDKARVDLMRMRNVTLVLEHTMLVLKRTVEVDGDRTR